MADLRHLFSSKGDHGLYLYKHKHEDRILKQAKDLLGSSPAGARQLKIAETQGIDIKIIKNPEQNYFVPDSHHVYIAVPTDLADVNAELVLDLSQALREAEQLLLGFAPTTDDMESEEYAVNYHARQVDIIVYMFQVAEELQNSGKNDVFLDKVELYGYGDLYRLYKQNVSQEEIIDLYLSYREKKN